jgi:putative Holliday junction resolvase
VDAARTPPPRALGLDYGQARIGVAVSDELGLLAHPREFVPAQPPQRALRQLVALVKREEIGQVIVGLPRNMDGSEGLSALKARRFAAELGRALVVPVALVDERLSTVQAGARLRESGRDARASKTRIDSASAAVLLQAWLDGQNSGR